MKANKNLLMVILLFITTLISYANIYYNEFVWDDEFFIVENTNTKDLSNIPGFFTEPSPGYLYRPMRSVFYAAIFQVWRLNAFGYHLNSFLLHFFATTLLFFITLSITGKTAFSFVASVFFAAHPVHTDRVTNMTASFDIYGILFLLLALFFYILFIKKDEKYYHWSSVIFYLLALFSSEEAITLILILFLYDLSFNHRIGWGNIRIMLKKYMPYIIATIFYLIIRFSVVAQLGREQSYFHGTFYGTFLTTLKVYIKYIALLFLPINLTIEHSTKFETTVFSATVILSILILLAIAFIFIKSYKRSKLLFFSIGWFLITLLPFSNFVPQISIMAERYLYLPSYGFVLLLASAIFAIKKIKLVEKYSNAIIVVLVILITAAYASLTIERNSEWKDGFALYTADLKKNPFGTHLNQGLAQEYKKIGGYDKAIFYAEKAIQYSKENYRAYETLATSYAEKKQYGKAIEIYEAALGLKPDYYLVYNDLGLVYSYLGDFNSSVFYLKKAIEINPKLSKAYNDLGTVYAQMGEFDLAIKEMEKSIEINPYNAGYYYNLAVIYEFLGNNDKAKELLIKGAKIEPDNEKVKSKLAGLKP